MGASARRKPLAEVSIARWASPVVETESEKAQYDDRDDGEQVVLEQGLDDLDFGATLEGNKHDQDANRKNGDELPSPSLVELGEQGVSVRHVFSDRFVRDGAMTGAWVGSCTSFGVHETWYRPLPADAFAASRREPQGIIRAVARDGNMESLGFT